MRIGHGFDVHKFGGEGPLVIGGVRIPYDKGLLAHSTVTLRCTPRPTPCWALRRWAISASCSRYRSGFQGRGQPRAAARSLETYPCQRIPPR